MSHVIKNKTRLLARTRRIQGQVNALEKALSEGAECIAVLTQITAVRGAVQGLMIEVLDDHLREHLSGEDDAAARDAEVTQVMGILRSYFK
jgi:DNA-binding FrmR family transcriptional regulator